MSDEERLSENVQKLQVDSKSVEETETTNGTTSSTTASATASASDSTDKPNTTSTSTSNTESETVNQLEEQSEASDGDSQTEKESKDLELQLRKDKESKLTEQEKNSLCEQAQTLKESGNSKFKQQCYTDSVADYTEALSICPLSFVKERSIMYSNRAAAYIHLEQTDKVIDDCTEAIQLHPHYIKPLLRRAQTYEKTDKLDEALTDYKKVLELDPRSVEAIQACQRLPPMINERNEKLKTEMMGKLKDLGNLVLRPFGLSTNNFQFTQNEGGGYSVNFVNKS